MHFYPFWVIDTAEVNDGVLASFMLALCLALGTRGIQTSGPFTSLLYGLALAGLALLRAATLPFAFIALVWYLYRSRLESRLALHLLAFLGFANGLAPWAVRNYQVFHQPIPIVDSAWLHLWIGNNPQATGGPPTEAMWFSDTAKKLQDQDIKDQPRRYDRLARDAWEEIKSEPVKTIHAAFRPGPISGWATISSRIPSMGWPRFGPRTRRKARNRRRPTRN